jgi:hypothetical protein
MTKNLMLVAVMAGVLAAGAARAQTPFGGDDDGFLPPDKQSAACENAIAKALAKSLVCVANCHAARAAGKLDETAEENCESNASNPGSCKSKYNALRDKLLASGTCPACLGQVAMDQVFAQGEMFLDSGVNGQIYCAQ